MAAIPPHLSETNRRSSSENRAALSYGRGGAGNIGSTPVEPQPVSEKDLQTPTIKSDFYTTGRGGSGNMSKNVDAEATRRAQDVTGNPRRISENKSHIGRGGSANIYNPSPEDLEAAKKDKMKWESAVADEVVEGQKSGDQERSKGLAEKGKEWLFGRK
ncbi:hypothetical protein GLAREA_04975 [Glarea lozoyensis ATCC 20868]|uniref:Uncharacterized protein n=1 Tax=Glarea lozoyensis (strain ATCC 20868 / MF5171) TaxID=1116229 RepID=S3CSZ0_GLAL2|nr:uncharacterized protein GLAREA_04975 [Glarea lozoyensis ATCC 20868]EPE28184.1 hypothetical protein GLAREA_04975 [Glarea lozoyensis ATCC 20868]